MLYYLLLLTAQDARLTVREPVAANPWTEVFRGRCGRDELEVIRAVRPSGESTSIRFNGLPVRGEVGALAGDLSEARASYRFSFLCSKQGGIVFLRWVRGLADTRGEVAYRSGAASFRGGELIEARSESATQEAFWFR
jgi:hypothetical protein